MFHTLALAALLTPQSGDLALHLPPTALAAVRLPSPRATAALRGENDYVSLVLEPRALSALDTFLEFTGESSEDPVQALSAADLVRAAEACDELVAYFESAEVPSDPPAAAVVVARGGDPVGEVFASLIGSDASERPPTSASPAVVGAKGPLEAYVRRGDLHIAATAPSIELALAAIERFETHQEGEAPTGPFTKEGVTAQRAMNGEAHLALELAFDLAPLWKEATATAPDAPSRWLVENCSSVEWIYGAWTLGKDEVTHFELTAPFDPESKLGDMLGYLQPIDLDALSVVPASAVKASAFAIDLDGLARWLQRTLRAVDVDAANEFDGALAAAKEALGVDLVDGLFAAVEDTFVSWEDLPEVPAFEDEEEGLIALSMPTTAYAVGLEDPEPLFALMATAETFLAGMGEVETDVVTPEGTEIEVETWSVDMGFLGAVVGITEDDLVLKFGPRAAFDEALALLGNPAGAQRYVADPAIAAALASTGGTVRGGLTVQASASTADVLVWMVETFEPLFASEFGRDRYRRLGDAILEVAELARATLEGYYVSTLSTEKDRLIIRMRSF